MSPFTLSNMNISATSGLVTMKFYQKHHWGRGKAALGMGKIGSELWFPWQHIAPIGLYWVKRCCHFFSAGFPILFILAGTDDMHESSEEFEIRCDSTTDCEVSCPLASEKIPIDL